MHYTALPAMGRAMARGANPGACYANSKARFDTNVRAIKDCFDVKLCQELSFFDADGGPLQLAWTLTRRSDPREHVVVTFDGAEWLVCEQRHPTFEPVQYIEAVRQLSAERRAARKSASARPVPDAGAGANRTPCPHCNGQGYILTETGAGLGRRACICRDGQRWEEKQDNARR